MPLTLEKSLDDFMQRYVELHQAHQRPLLIEYDSQWISPCHDQSGQDGEEIIWVPKLRQETSDLASLSSALEMDIDPQFCQFISRYWSDNINAKNDRGSLTLLFPWNHDDFERLQQNLVGHVLMKRRLQQAETLFFAVTDEDDFILSIENSTGRVVLEQVGLEPCEVIADNLAVFLSSLTPILTD